MVLWGTVQGLEVTSNLQYAMPVGGGLKIFRPNDSSYPAKNLPPEFRKLAGPTWVAEGSGRKLGAQLREKRQLEPTKCWSPQNGMLDLQVHDDTDGAPVGSPNTKLIGERFAKSEGPTCFSPFLSVLFKRLRC